MDHNHKEPFRAPIAARHPTIRQFHGDTFVDHYEWLRAKDSPKVIEHLQAENTYAESATEHLQPIRERLFEDIKGRVQETDLSVPYRRGNWWYYTRTVEDQEHAIHCKVAAETSPNSWDPPIIPVGSALPGEHVLLDGNAEAAAHDFWSLGSFEITPDGQWMLWATDTTGDERFTVHVKNLITGQVLDDQIPNTAGAFLSPDAQDVFYIELDHTWRPWQVKRHRLGQPLSEDVVIAQEHDPGLWLSAELSANRQWVILESSCADYTEISLLDLTTPHLLTPHIVVPRDQRILYQAEPLHLDGKDVIVISHNLDSLDGTLSLIDFHALGEPLAHQQPIELIPASAGYRILGFTATSHWLVVTLRVAMMPTIGILPLKSLTDERIPQLFLVQENTVVAASHAQQQCHNVTEQAFESIELQEMTFESPVLRFTAESFTRPTRVYDLMLDTHEPTELQPPVLRKERAVLGGYNPHDYIVERDYAHAADGTAIPVTLIRHRHAATPAPTVMYAYGSYEISMDPTFSYSRLNLLDRGVVWAIAHVRGGGEMGRHWYESGKKLRKPNTFTDLVSVTRKLASRADINEQRILLMGGSAGGLLVGAVLNLAPELYCGAIASVPFVDPLTSILMPELPLTALEWEEWGNPIEDPQIYSCMKAYSPYENIHGGAYPPILAVTSLHDTRVLYVEPAKWIAELRHTHPTDAEQFLMRIDMTSGHGGASGRYQHWKDAAWEDAWALERLGLV